MSPMTDISPIRFERVRRVKFDRWLFDHGLDNVEAGRLFGAHPLTIGRWRRRFDDPARRVPPKGKIREIDEVTSGEVGLLDWYRPALVLYVEDARTAVSEAAE